MATKITYTQQGDYLLPNLKLPEQDIIDEYDTPIQQGHSCGFYQEVIDYMRNFFSGGLKDNSHLAYCFLSVVFFKTWVDKHPF